MIPIKVKVILGIIPLVGGYREQVITMEDNSNVEDLISELTYMYGDKLKNKLLDDIGEVRPGIAMFLNGRNIFALKGFKTKLNVEDEFLIFPPVGGG